MNTLINIIIFCGWFFILKDLIIKNKKLKGDKGMGQVRTKCTICGKVQTIFIHNCEEPYKEQPFMACSGQLRQIADYHQIYS